MGKVFKSKITLGIVCILLAAAIAFLLLPRFYASRADIAKAVKLSEDVPVGTIITGDMLTTADVGAYGLPNSVVQIEADAIGLVASENLYAGEFLTTSRLITEEEYQKLVAEQTKGLENGYCLVSVSFPSSSAGVASVLRGGHNTSLLRRIHSAEYGDFSFPAVGLRPAGQHHCQSRAKGQNQELQEAEQGKQGGRQAAGQVCQPHHEQSDAQSRLLCTHCHLRCGWFLRRQGGVQFSAHRTCSRHFRTDCPFAVLQLPADKSQHRQAGAPCFVNDDPLQLIHRH